MQRSALLLLVSFLATALAVDVFTVNVVGGIGGAKAVPGDAPGFQFIQYCSGTLDWDCRQVRGASFLLLVVAANPC